MAYTMNCIDRTGTRHTNNFASKQSLLAAINKITNLKDVDITVLNRDEEVFAQKNVGENKLTFNRI